jgi:hypothetical protein
LLLGFVFWIKLKAHTREVRMGLAWVEKISWLRIATQAPQIDRPNPRTEIDAQIHGELAAIPTAGARDLAAVPHIRGGEATAPLLAHSLISGCCLGV